MPRDLILGTAGHIDHGKTSLVKALTGIDCDRLPEEKLRGITIDIGFAHLELGEARLGIVDVPGHERFIKNMLAGATGIDLALLVVAADDSVMPQTREHLEILQLLNLRHGVIALTKADLVDETSLEVAKLEVRELTRGTFLETAPVIATSARTGMGLNELRSALAEASQLQADSSGPRRRDLFRLAIDRCFSVPGHGTVVTGTVTTGSVRVGDEVVWLPRGDTVRIRGLQCHDAAVEEVHRGMRAAMNLAGVKHEEVARGQELATPGFLEASQVLTLRLTTLSSQSRPIKHRLPIRFHLGTAEVMGTLSLLEDNHLAPGQTALAQVFLEEPVVARWGQPFVVRGSSATATLGGGTVLQPVARKIRRRHAETLEQLRHLQSGEPEQRAKVVAWFNAYQGVAAADLARGAGLDPASAGELLERLLAAGHLQRLGVGPNRTVLLPTERVEALKERIVTILRNLHEQFPLMSSHDRQKLESQLGYLEEPGLVHAATERLLGEGRLVGDARRLALAEHRPRLSQAQRRLKDKLVDAFASGGFQPPDLQDFVGAAGGAPALRDLVALCVQEGLLVPISEEIFLAAAVEEDLRQRVTARLAATSGLTVAEIRDLLGTTRKFAVPLCEYLDRIGITRREGDLRIANPAKAVTS